MFKSSTATVASGKFFLALLLFFTASCSSGGAGNNSAANSNSFIPNELNSQIPFSTLEPEIYQTEIVTRIFTASGEKSERSVLSARNGAKRLTIFNFGEKNEHRRLELSPDMIVSIYSDKKIYTENTTPGANSTETTNDFLTTEWLNQKTTAVFDNLGKENNLSKFRTKLGDTGNARNEVVIYFDENLKLPVKQEFYSGDMVAGEQKALTFSVELKDFKSQTDEKLFELPKDYRKVSQKEFQEIVWKDRTNDE